MHFVIPAMFCNKTDEFYNKKNAVFSNKILQVFVINVQYYSTITHSKAIVLAILTLPNDGVIFWVIFGLRF